MILDLDFDAATHTYRWKGRIVPSVTQVLQLAETELVDGRLVSIFDRVRPDVLESARRFGTHVHQATDLYDRGILDEESLDIPLVPYLNAYKKFLRETGFKVTHTEERVYHRKLGYAGTLDRRGLWKRDSWLLDLKSGEVPRSVGAQTAAYREALDGEKPHRRLCLQLRRNAYKLIQCDDRTNFSLFVSCLNLWKFVTYGKRPIEIRSSGIAA